MSILSFFMTKITLDLDALTRSHIITQDQRDQILAWQNKDTTTE